MAKLYNLARMNSPTVGTGTLTLSAAVSSYLSFESAGAVSGDLITYALFEGTNREIGEGAYTSAGGVMTVARTTVISSTNAGAAVTLAGAAEVFITASSRDFPIGKQSIWVPALAMVPRVNNGAELRGYDSGSDDRTIRVMAFDSTTEEFAHFSVAMPTSWDEGTLTFRAFATAETITAATTVVFKLGAVAVSDGDSLNIAVGTAASLTYTPSTANDLHITAESTGITVAGTPAAGDMVNFAISRDVAADNAVSDALLIGTMVYLNVITGQDG